MPPLIIYYRDSEKKANNMKGIKSEPVAGPMSSAGIMRFFDISGGGPKISPMVVVGAAVGFLVIERIANIIF